uniref:FAS1 domain-containing protein n=1 Tax=Strigamia maritima TaxID=126957 RepID=T1JE53_STRMM
MAIINQLNSIPQLLTIIFTILHLSTSNPDILKPVFPAGTLMKAQIEAQKNVIFSPPHQQNFIQDANHLYNMDTNMNQQQGFQLPLGISPQQLMMAQQAPPSFVAMAQNANQMQIQQKTFMVQLLKNFGLNVLSDFLQNVDVPELFEQPGLPKTILAPSDDAFSILPDVLMTKMRRDGRQIARLLRYHVLPGSFPAESIANDMVVSTFNSNLRVRFNVYGKDEKRVKL